MSSTLQADAFKRLYSEEYFDNFIKEGLRPDGRGLGVCRPVTVAVNAISSADGSAIAKVRLLRWLFVLRCSQQPWLL
jgi:exosome complex component RRP43